MSTPGEEEEAEDSLEELTAENEVVMGNEEDEFNGDDDDGDFEEATFLNSLQQ